MVEDVALSGADPHSLLVVAEKGGNWESLNTYLHILSEGHVQHQGWERVFNICMRRLYRLCHWRFTVEGQLEATTMAMQTSLPLLPDHRQDSAW